MSDTFQRRLGDGKVASRARDLARAQDAYQDALGAAGTDDERSQALGGLGVVLDQLLDRAGALTRMTEALALARSSQSAFLPSRLHDLAICHLGRGEAAEAAPLLEEAWPLWESSTQRASSVEILGHAYLQVGELRRAESAYQQLSALGDELQRGDLVLRGQNGRGEALRRAGRNEDAKRVFQSVVEALSGVSQPTRGDQEQAGVALHNLGVLLLEERPAAARTFLDQAVTCFVDAFGTAEHPHVARAKAFLGRLAALGGDAAAADAAYAEALRLVSADDPVATELVPALRGA